ncbi:LysR family transcriptional regulator [Pseudomonas sp. FW306-02-F02-AA]|uniref:LysR family transcriptional regulator n=1 Tax=Pseudomonas fluorescens TaxID=294 RepID=A0A0N7H0R8_PSEFL|nr:MULTISPECIES: LysR substrate-binding domain-containing protein [Pseudomonas]ALI03900.1 LysR family transcriptional regulator [Pseudomonas fluorescens]PMZ04827.1 LysR family transcriptional regulator [Pseudomonas sp. FW306-02-F02-AB]PMZ11991.1 LysR family transcriptional regulator [Pseudomonas sp. FW306-02-H06C]PMZ17752.1 LysR family transcriptional regulator [Pseudomonas sp. FW306-02-F02-AA]PMZ23784.1 LysR family transcriptional regulator [Pseudomonas sp. FW306-02-F08-AA]
MRLRHIEVIQALLQTGHLGTAAEMLQLPVAGVEGILREAEDQLGFMLFASVRGRLQATREARELQVEIAHVYEALEPLQRLANSLKQYLAPPLRIICTPPLAQHLLPQGIATLRRRFPDAPCSLLSQPTRDIVRSLLLRESDLGLSLHDPDHPDIQCQIIAQGKLQLLAPHGWLQPKQKYISVQDLAGQSMVGLEGHDPLSVMFESKLQALRPAPVVQTRVQTHQMMRSMVEAGEGLAVVDPFTAIGAKASGLDVCPVSPAVPISLYALTLNNAEIAPATQALLEIIKEQAEAMLAS